MPDPDLTASIADPNMTTASMSAIAADASASSVSAGRYELGPELARGGMGEVYRATDSVFGREVAVKVLQEKYAPTSGTACRFADEARISGQLQHPNIPAVHDLGTLPDGRPFMAMKLIKGDTLDDLLKARSDPSADRGRFVAVFEQVCQALAYAHAHNVLHRDLKPANVMVGAFGEVQVMDWGLAKVLGTRDAEVTDPDATAAPTVVQSIRQTDSAFTQAGSILGTPAYMPPEQAVGAIHKVDARSDVFGLGAILAVILTGKPPFVGKSAATTRLQAAQGDVEECFARLDASGAEPELVALCKRCLSKRPDDRPADAGEVAQAVASLRAAADERARQAELEAVQLEGERQKAEVQATEQRKRRRVQLALAWVVVLVAVGGGVAAVQVQAQREQDRIAADQQTRQKERETRAISLAASLASAETPVVPRILTDLADLRELARPKLAELAAQPVNTKPGLHARLALLPDEPERAKELTAYLPACQPEELLTLRESLMPNSSALAPGLWAVLTDAKTDAGKRVRVACVLAGLTQDDRRWATVAGDVVGGVVKENPLQAAVWAQALDPVRLALLPALLKRYTDSRTKIESGTLAVTDLATEATASDLTASLLARYAADRPLELAELAMTADARHLPLFAGLFDTNRGAIAPRLEAEIDRTLPPEMPSSDPQRETLAKRQANAAVALLRLNQPAKVWPLLKHSPDPRVRSYLIHRLFPLGADPAAIVQRLDTEPDLSARRALLLALGEFDEATFPVAARTALLPRVQALYRVDPDPGLHAAAEWLLRQWKQDNWIRQQNAAWTKENEAREKVLVGIATAVKTGGAQAPPRWYVNSQGQTFVVIPGPVEFHMGSPSTEKERYDNEVQHRRRIGRSFAMASKSVTVEEYRRFNPRYSVTERFAREPDCPVVSVTWYQAAAYCNWLSEQEKIPRDQWVYEIKGATDIKLKKDYLSLTGYRLPTEAEVECAIRARATTSRYFGETEELLNWYAWNLKNSSERTWPVGLKKPNDFGLFDALGNCFTWCQEAYADYPRAEGGEAVDDKEGSLLIISTRIHLLRGVSFMNPASYVRSASRGIDLPTSINLFNGFRPAKTFTP